MPLDPPAARTLADGAGDASRSPMGALILHVNGEERRVTAPCTVEGLLQALAQDRRRIAVAVNREVVPRSGYAHHALASGDRIEILEAVGGG